MLCGTSHTCTLTQCPRWQNGDHPKNNDINLYRLDDFPCTLDRLNDDHPQYNNNIYPLEDCSNNHGDKDCYKAHENIKSVTNFLNERVRPITQQYLENNSFLELVNRMLKSYIVLDSQIDFNQLFLEHPDYSLCNNAYTLPFIRKIIFGQYNNQRHSTADQLEIVAHEFGHILIAQIFPNGFASEDNESKALEESFCDFFAILVSRYVEGQWNWEIGRNMGNTRGTLRNFQDPQQSDPPQPCHYCDFNERQDYHNNCSIHNKACAEITQNIDNFDFLIELFCLTLLQLKDVRKSNITASISFADSRRAMEDIVTAMSDLSITERNQRLLIIGKAFYSVGIGQERKSQIGMWGRIKEWVSQLWSNIFT